MTYTPPGAPQPQGGGPDPFGYTWRASTELGGPLYDWLDATGGMTLTLTDDGAANITLPFAFAFYTSASTSLRVSNNGAMLFNSPAATLGYTNEPFASTPVRNLIAPFWDDLYDNNGAVVWKVFGTAPNRRVVVEWLDRPHYQAGGGAGTATFEAVLFEDGDILFQYQDVDFGAPAYDRGASATVGLHGPRSIDYLQFSHNTASVAGNLALCFDRPGSTACGLGDALPWVEAAPAAGSLPGGLSASQALSLTWAAPLTAVVPGTYRGNLWLMTNDPAAPNVFLPLTLTVPLPALQFATSAQTVTERSEPVTVTAQLSAPAAVTITVAYAVGGSATGSGIDYNLANGSLVFPPGTASQSLTFRARIDALAEPDETVVISLGTPVNAVLGAVAQHTVTIVDFPMPFTLFLPYTRR